YCVFKSRVFFDISDSFNFQIVFPYAFFICCKKMPMFNLDEGWSLKWCFPFIKKRVVSVWSLCWKVKGKRYYESG
ncbi:MAG: hypothetical protein WBQ32_13890, partial [Ignavibacteriaceae bacterium]